MAWATLIEFERVDGVIKAIINQEGAEFPTRGTFSAMEKAADAYERDEKGAPVRKIGEIYRLIFRQTIPPKHAVINRESLVLVSDPDILAEIEKASLKPPSLRPRL